MSAKNIQEFDLTLFQRANYPTIYSMSTSIYPQLLLTKLRKMWELDQILKIYGGNIIVSISSSSFIIEVTTEAALGLIGGTMGLFTGFSILSAVEIIYHLLKVFLSLVSPKWK